MQEQTNLNLIPQKEKPVVNASQYDNGRVVRFNLKHGEDEFTLTGSEVIECNIRKVDGHVVTITPTVVADKTYIDVYLTEQANACFGDQIGELRITMSDTVIGTCNFILRVEKSPMTGGVTSASDIDNLTTQITEIVVDVLGDNYYTKTETDSAIAEAIAEVPTFDPTNYYDKSDVNTLLSAKADSSSVYTKSEVDNALGLKANAADVYTKSEANDLLSAKADSADLATVATSGSYNDLINKPYIPNTFSTTEEQIIGTWIDGRPIYRKVVVYDNTIASASGWLTLLSVTNVEAVINGWVIVDENVGGRRYGKRDMYLIEAAPTYNNIQIYNASPYGVYVKWVVVEYIKSV